MQKINAFPHHYVTQIDANGVLSAGSRVSIAGGIPQQFGGSDKVWGPEDLLVGAAGLCLLTTFQSLAQKEPLSVSGYHCSADGTLEKTASGLGFTSIRLTVELTVAAAEEEQARLLMQRAKKYCIVANALNCPVELVLSVQPSETESATGPRSALVR